MYKIPCKSCPAVYIGETSRNFGYRIKEHQKDVDTVTEHRNFTRAAEKASLAVFNKSAITDHVAKKNHVINWKDSRIVGNETNNHTRKIIESVRIKSEKFTMNRDEGGVKIPAVYDVLLRAPPIGRYTH